MSLTQPLPPKQAAAFIGCSVDQLRRLDRAGEIPSVNIGLGKIRQRRVYHLEDLQAFKQRRASSSRPPAPQHNQPASYQPRWA
ncbi:helix-turn-helix domain-containing protein [Rhodopirellula bahusiensis]|uniref:helix-turn-helix domain-containing protein n=1 Tax=Rhodopirellula bahusiensis TaxID=2014065 RepID=UPI00130406EA|nr:helix-turn-helix domain-containing protein [Rhodopirellula bahusiensis]